MRNAGIDCPILLLSPVADGNEAELLIDRSITACVGSRDSALLLEETAQRRSAVIEAHLKLDTGFGRYGFLPGEEEEIAKLCAGLPHLKITGCFTHFSNAFGKDPSSVNRQMSVYREMTEKLEQAGMALGMKHAANSTAALRFPETRLDAVRIGSAFLGRLSVPNEWGVPARGPHGVRNYQRETLAQGFQHWLCGSLPHAARYGCRRCSGGAHRRLWAN